jgi:hypothetical protein
MVWTYRTGETMGEYDWRLWFVGMFCTKGITPEDGVREKLRK